MTNGAIIPNSSSNNNSKKKKKKYLLCVNSINIFCGYITSFCEQNITQLQDYQSILS